MQVGAGFFVLIEEFEGFRATPYDDPVGHCTVGYGELIHYGNCTPEELARPPMTEEEGKARLVVKAQPYANAVEEWSRPLNQNEFDAMTSLCYNIGPGGYASSAVRQAVNNGGDVCAALRQVVHGTDGVVYPGLVRRREAECKLFYAPVLVEDDMFVRFNGVAGYFQNRVFDKGVDYHMALRTDFPKLPPTVRAVELDVRIDPATSGALVLKDGPNKAYADSLNRSKSQAVVRVIPAPDGRIFFDVVDAQIKFLGVGIVGYWS